ncbi:MAG TPA: heat-inducible transcriptional repressor HrcA [Bacillota bacterium]
MLDQRKREVLRAIVQDYVLTAEPVGSRTIARRYALGVSPATIRNEMADLEEMGYLEQPHTSAGRIPSSKGYRFYVDELMDTTPPSHQYVELVRRIYTEHAREIETLLRHTVRVLAEATDCLAVAEGPDLAAGVLNSVQFLLIRPGRAVMVLVTDEGLVDHHILDIPPDIGQRQLAQIAAALTHRLAGIPIGQLSRSTLQLIQQELSEYRAVVDLALELLSTTQDDEQRFVVGGTSNIFKQPEFRDVERAHALLTVLNEHQLISDLMGSSPQGSRPAVIIGEENPVAAMQSCSCVIATYMLDDREVGKIAVIGPTRMDYGRVIGLVDLVTQSLSDVLSRRLG